MTAWSIRWTERAVQDLDTLDPPVARRVVAKLEQAARNPGRYFRRLGSADDYKLRIGDYRLLAVLSHETKTIYVERVDHRSRVYERGR
ncbi:MAG TPA: type II toxin-antitoxin system RelE/ParE family toxin [Thermoplasmata archaeon]